MTQVSAGGYYALARRAGSVWAWGANNNGERGLGTAGPAVRTPQKIPGLSPSWAILVRT